MNLDSVLIKQLQNHKFKIQIKILGFHNFDEVIQQINSLIEE